MYLREAHPSDGWKMSDWSTIEDPKTQLQRALVASQCSKKLEFAFTTVVDTMDDKTAVAWAAWPERIFVIDKAGRVAYAGHQGPWGFWPTDRFKKNGKMKKMTGESLDAFLGRFLGNKPPANSKSTAP